MYQKDVEGYTPFDVYNSTVDGTNPVEADGSQPYADLYTWGSNRNAALGLGDADDRSSPEQVIIRRGENQTNIPLHSRLKAVPVISIAMSKFYTTIVTAESRGNIRSCGFASGGRLGQGTTNNNSHAQYSLINPQSSLPHMITSLALGQDHTLAVTSTGEVLSWGLNRFGQLGYVIEGSTKAAGDQVQAAARKITGPLRNQIVLGVACCKTASVCWTSTQLFTWGTNSGQLGYEKTAQPQILPRLVPSISESVSGVAITENAMLVLLKSGEVICFHDGSYWKLFFPSQRVNRALGKDKSGIRKVIAGDGSAGHFALISKLGDVYLFNTEDYSGTRKDGSKDVNSRPTPQPVWAVRKQFTAVRDVALGAEGSLILCTKSGHVFVRSRVLRASLAHALGGSAVPSKGTSSFKFQRINNLQRVIRVCANSTGSFAALRLDATPRPLSLEPKSFMGELAKLMPFKCYLSQYATKVLSNAETSAKEATIEEVTSLLAANDADDDEAPETDITHDIRLAIEMCEYLSRASVISSSVKASPNNSSLAPDLGADLQLKSGNFVLPIHRIVLATCIPALRPALRGGRLRLTDSETRRVFNFDGGVTSGDKSFTINIRALWDRRVALAISSRYGNLQIDTSLVQSELRSLASPSVLGLPELAMAAQSVGLAIAKPSIALRFETMLKAVQDDSVRNHNVVLVLADRRIKAHSTILRARSPFFATFFDRECWTTQRLVDGKGVIEVDLRQFKYRSMSYLLRYLYGDVSVDLFDTLDFIQSTDQLIEFIFEIISCSNYLLTDYFTKQCSSYILRYVDIHNVTSVLVEASHFNALDLVSTLHGYMANNLETLLEMHVLGDLPFDVLKAFTEFVRQQQRAMHPFIRNDGNLPLLEEKWTEWLSLQDIPTMILPTRAAHAVVPAIQHHQRSFTLDQGSSIKELPIQHSPIQSHKIPAQCDDEPFSMDTDGIVKPLALPGVSTSPTQSKTFPIATKAWRSPTVVEKSNMKSIMEAEQMASTSRNSPPKLTDSVGGRKVSFDKGANPSYTESMRAGGKSTSSEETLQKSASSSQPIWITPSKQQPRGPLSTTASTSCSPPQAIPSSVKQSSGPLNSIQASSSPTKPVARSVKPSVRPEQFGPLIAPTRNTPSNIIRRSSSGDGPAWSATPPPQTTSTLSQCMSFAAIQEEQAVKPAPPGPRKGLREIQEEEQESAFLRWFEEESARVQQREAAAIATALSEQSKKSKSSRGGRGGNRGRGERGKGRGRGIDHRVTNIPTTVHSNTP
ncbi:hypothetical protein FRC17_002346 [Serendipita sp. 399]|nr:hypothetical protein FRC17_002346 [Serendipita sp. 399]